MSNPCFLQHYRFSFHTLSQLKHCTPTYEYNNYRSKSSKCNSSSNSQLRQTTSKTNILPTASGHKTRPSPLDDWTIGRSDDRRDCYAPTLGPRALIDLNADRSDRRCMAYSWLIATTT
ncbi:unnamed protein product [Ceratitis capitata]|uniref:(Mediterranean fruit fly) hypothetical protein n=1 Tax=Ceratitis capitata TaxID=7213 RepID=A0A811UDJ0_CERCA|nr:unnamed protein product [Ceratitis capitata]